QNRDDQHLAATDTVAHRAEEDTAKRPGQKRQREHTEGFQQRAALSLEKLVTDGGREIAIHTESNHSMALPRAAAPTARRTLAFDTERLSSGSSLLVTTSSVMANASVVPRKPHPALDAGRGLMSVVLFRHSLACLQSHLRYRSGRRVATAASDLVQIHVCRPRQKRPSGRLTSVLRTNSRQRHACAAARRNPVHTCICRPREPDTTRGRGAWSRDRAGRPPQ